MDLFTHVVIAYLLSFGVWGPGGLQYIAAGAMAGGLPDADALLFPLATRFPLLRHHGITHSILGVTIIAAAGAFIVPAVIAAVLGSAFAAGSPLLYFLAMEAGGLSHVFLDGFTHFSVPPLAPFSKWELHLDADRAINIGTLAFTAFSLWLMIYERGRVPVWVWETTAWVLLAGYLGYLSVRLLGRVKAGQVQRRERFKAVIPQGNPFVFLLIDEDTSGPRLRVRYAEYSLFHGYRGEIKSIDVPKAPPPSGPVHSPEEALELSYAPSLKHGRVLAITYHFATVKRLPDRFRVFWYSLEFTMLGRAAGVIADVDVATGQVRTRSAWQNPARALS